MKDTNEAFKYKERMRLSRGHFYLIPESICVIYHGLNRVSAKEQPFGCLTYIKAMDTCLRSFSIFFMFAKDWAQNIIANHEHSLYCRKRKQRMVKTELQ